MIVFMYVFVFERIILIGRFVIVEVLKGGF